MAEVLFSIIVLTYNRVEIIADLLNQFTEISRYDVEFIIVDNGSIDGTSEFVVQNYPNFRLIRSEVNLGAVGRNIGMAEARGKYVVTIDDDILDINDDSLTQIEYLFERNPKIGAICFKIIDFYSTEICNWCHPKDPEEFSEIFFETNEVSEGAVAFKREVIEEIGLYPKEFFISHEGADMVARIVNHGYQIYYTPGVVVRHKYAQTARTNWRRYYYDTRNDFWVAIKNYRLPFVFIHLTRRIAVTFIYSLRDGFLLFWLKAIKDALLELPEIVKQRKPISINAQRKLGYLNRDKPGFIYFLKNRLFTKSIKI